MKIVVLDGYTLNPGDLDWNGLEALGELTVYDRTAPEDVIARIGDAELIYTNKTVISREILDACPSVKFIGVLATGYNVVDTEAAKEKGIPVCNVPTYGTTAVAQYTFALLLEICHHVWAHSEAVKAGAWASCPDFCFWNYPLFELAGVWYTNRSFADLDPDNATRFLGISPAQAFELCDRIIGKYYGDDPELYLRHIDRIRLIAYCRLLRFTAKSKHYDPDFRGKQILHAKEMITMYLDRITESEG